MKKCKKNFNSKNGINGVEFNKIYLYQISCENEIIYIGITNDLISTQNRHFLKIHNNNAKFSIIGEFYDRHLAEFFEIKLIQECLNNGSNLLNKITNFR
jgi:predicted GIY-YIG superfamily endonuclease